MIQPHRIRTFAYIVALVIVVLLVSGISAPKTEETIVVEKVEPITVDMVSVVEDIIETKHIMRCKLTAYCGENYYHICNNGDATNTATMTTPTPGRTIAVDPTVIPYGSEVVINGHTYIAEDCGGAVKGNRIDVLFATHQEALEFGIQYADVEIYTKG